MMINDILLINVLHVNLNRLTRSKKFAFQERCIPVWDVLYQDFFGLSIRDSYSCQVVFILRWLACIWRIYCSRVNETRSSFANFYRGYFNCECEQLIPSTYIRNGNIRHLIELIDIVI